MTLNLVAQSRGNPSLSSKTPRGTRLRSIVSPCRHAFGLVCVAGMVLTGCNEPGTIDLDFSGQPVRFLIHHRGWPRPFLWPRVTEFAIASEEDGAIWQLRSEDSEGQPARELAIIYGRLPSGFVQEFPAGTTAPVPLQSGRTYYVAAGGPRAVYRMVFALPITALERENPRQPTTSSAPAR